MRCQQYCVYAKKMQKCLNKENIKLLHIMFFAKMLQLHTASLQLHGFSGSMRISIGVLEPEPQTMYFCFNFALTKSK
jgi:hypothetical protein